MPSPDPQTNALVTAYLSIFPDEREALSPLLAQLVGRENIYTRTNWNGHVTASMLVFSPDHRSVLLVDHKTLGFPLQPGGHYEADGSHWENARRELAEETGLTKYAVHPWHMRYPAFTYVPFDISSYPVPAVTSKNEPAHQHHDFLFLAMADPAAKLTAQEEEVENCRWCLCGNLVNSRPPRIIAKMRRVGIAVPT